MSTQNDSRIRFGEALQLLALVTTAIGGGALAKGAYDDISDRLTDLAISAAKAESGIDNITDRFDRLERRVERLEGDR
jgi:hypothetical protein